METEIDLKGEATLQILKGLDYLHRKSNVHGNLKSPKVCQQKKEGYQLKLTDFGELHAQLSKKKCRSTFLQS
jgi:serine/threonine protein kinase